MHSDDRPFKKIVSVIICPVLGLCWEKNQENEIESFIYTIMPKRS